MDPSPTPLFEEGEERYQDVRGDGHDTGWPEGSPVGRLLREG